MINFALTAVLLLLLKLFYLFPKALVSTSFRHRFHKIGSFCCVTIISMIIITMVKFMLFFFFFFCMIYNHMSSFLFQTQASLMSLTSPLSWWLLFAWLKMQAECITNDEWVNPVPWFYFPKFRNIGLKFTAYLLQHFYFLCALICTCKGAWG